jgi:hypothetical protein
MPSQSTERNENLQEGERVHETSDSNDPNRQLRGFLEEERLSDARLLQSIQERSIEDLDNELRNLQERHERLQSLRHEILQQREPLLQHNVSQRGTDSMIEDTYNILVGSSYETLIKRLYNIPVELPPFLIVNNLKVNFVPLENISNMFSRDQIHRYIIDPLLQPWAGPLGTEYRVFTVFGKNGMTYLVRARYNPEINQIILYE